MVGPDQAIYVAGYFQERLSEKPRIGVFRLLPNGQADLGYGDKGFAQLPTTEVGPWDPFVGYYVRGLAVEADGSAVVSELHVNASRGPSKPDLQRVSPDGSTVSILGSVCGGQVAIQADGEIITAGEDSEGRFCVSSSAAPGRQVESAQGVAGVLAVEPSGRVLVRGYILQTPEARGPPRFFAMYETDGLNREFGLAFLPQLGCAGRNPTLVAQHVKPQEEVPETGPTGPRAEGTARADVIVGTPAADRIRGDGGRDLVCAGAGRDRVFGGLAADRIYGGPGPDRLFGGPGKDRLYGGPGPDRLIGGFGIDRLFGGPGKDRKVR